MTVVFFPVDCVISLIRMVGEWLAIPPDWQAGSALVSTKSSFGLGLNFGFMFM